MADDKGKARWGCAILGIIAVIAVVVWILPSSERCGDYDFENGRYEYDPNDGDYDKIDGEYKYVGCSDDSRSSRSSYTSHGSKSSSGSKSSGSSYRGGGPGWGK